MSAPWTPTDEAARLRSLHVSGILDSLPEKSFDVITRIARRILKMPTAMISFIDQDRQWFKSALGMFSSGQETARHLAFCSEAVESPHSALVVDDATKDPRFSRNPLVTQKGGIRFYAGVPLLDKAGLALGTLCVIDVVPRHLGDDEMETLRDLAESASAALELHRSLASLEAQADDRRNSIDQNPQIPWTASPDGHILEVSPSLIVSLAAGPKPVHGADWTRLIHPDDLPETTRRRENALAAGEPYDIEHRMRAASGEWRWFRSYAAPKRDAEGRINLWYGSSEDISERKTSEAKVLRMAYHDSLTGLPNRARFSQLLETEIARAGKAAASFAFHSLDLDHFKSVNDRLGHPGGDAVLQQIATRLSECLQDNDVLARFGSDEFFIIQRDPVQSDGAAQLAERIGAVLSEPLAIEGHLFSVTASIGVAVYPQDGRDPDDLFRNADLALYRAKTMGRALCCMFDAQLDERQRLLQSLKLDLQDAINRDEFELAYQPLVNMQTGQVKELEALLRWKHPGRGWVSPAEFIPCAEESGLIIPIGEWVLKRACREAAAWPGKMRVAVNLSPVQFRDKALLETTAAALMESSLPADRLELEITESVLLLDDDVNLSLLRDLREMGIRIALDDFGTGYSSLSYLQRFPFDKLKIDRSLVSHVAESEGGRAVIRAVIAMCRALDISITAEGVETQEQFDRLRMESCDQVQGYLISRPVPSSEVPALIIALNETPREQSANLVG
jgi:diguanylate cyclase (GGDEF)-like protein/PAS domain S-box-containing protein